MKTLVVLLALALLVPTVADASGVLTFRQAKRAMHRQEARYEASGGPGADFTFERERCARVNARWINCRFRVRNMGSAACQYKVVVKLRRGKVRSRLVEDFATTPWCEH